MATGENPKPERPPATLNDAKWKTSKAKEKMAQDMIDGKIPLEGKIDSKEIYDRLYAKNTLFKDFPYDKVRYDRRMKTLRGAILRLQHWADYDNKAIVEDLQKYPKKATNIRGEPRWEGSAAEKFLKKDVDDGLHLGKDLKELWATRDEYKAFTKTVFRKHIDQEKQSRKTYKDGGKRYTRNIYGNKDLSDKNKT